VSVLNARKGVSLSYILIVVCCARIMEEVDEESNRRKPLNDEVWEATCSKVKDLLTLPYVPQGSPEWHRLRKGMLTSSDVATALGENPYCKPDALFRMKTHKLSVEKVFTGNYATRWGHKYEPEARREYEKQTGEFVYCFSLIPHPTIPWLGGSCDGITASGRLVEIKCPTSRPIYHEIPPYYMPQVQTLLEILDLDVCDFVQYKPADPRWGPMQYDRLVIKRDKRWFAQKLPILQDYWNRVVLERSREEVYQDAAAILLQRRARLLLLKTRVRGLETSIKEAEAAFKRVRSSITPPTRNQEMSSRAKRICSRKRVLEVEVEPTKKPKKEEEKQQFAFDFA